MSTFVANEGRGYLPQSAAIPDMVAETQVRLGSTAHALSPERTIAVHCRANGDLNRSQASFGVLQSTVTLGAARRGKADVAAVVWCMLHAARVQPWLVSERRATAAELHRAE